MAWAEVGVGGCSGVAPSGPHVLWGDRAQGVGQCGAGSIPPVQGPSSNRVLILHGRQGAQNIQEDGAYLERASGGRQVRQVWKFGPL